MLLSLCYLHSYCSNDKTSAITLWKFEFSSFQQHKGMKLHGKILKMGFCDEVVLCEHVMDFYLSCGGLNGETKVFGKMIVRTLSCWNKG